MSHSLEPWWIEPLANNDRRAEIHSGERTVHEVDGYVTSPCVVAYKVLPTTEDAERIAACVNACAGIPTEELKWAGKPIGWSSVAVCALDVLRRFYAAGGLQSLPAGTRVVPQITCSIESESLFVGERLDPDSFSNLSAALRVCHRNGYKIDDKAMEITSPGENP